MREIKVTNERILGFEAKYGKEAVQDLISIVNDTRDDLGYSDENENQKVADMINEGTQKIIEERNTPKK